MFEPEGVGDRADVVRRLGHRAVGDGMRAAVPGPVVGDQPDPELLELRVGRADAEPAAGRAVQEEDGVAVRGTPGPDGHPSSPDDQVLIHVTVPAARWDFARPMRTDHRIR